MVCVEKRYINAWPEMKITLHLACHVPGSLFLSMLLSLKGSLLLARSQEYPSGYLRGCLEGRDNL